MVTELKQKQKSLYDTDYHLWILDTIEKLEKKDLDSLDWENLIEEVSSLGRRDQKKIESLLTRLLEHLLKLQYWDSEKERNENHWKGEIINFRIQIRRELKSSPSLKRYLIEICEECYDDAKKIVSNKSSLPLNTFPKKLILSFEQILDENWLP
ncbi:DUF29 domain-containing protein [Geminocystis sp. CENA526]|uniref:DUF29 domain-containing protein n=1 Tax=Geminocystis sp. CENA526 TaxID=1355871 RepID=UPI003D6F3E12